MKNQPKIESRTINQAIAPVTVQKRDDGPTVITGHAAVFFREGDPATEYELWNDLVERIMPGAFDEALKGADVRGLFNHDPSNLLGRTIAETMRLSVDAKGLKYAIDAPETETGRSVVSAIERGDLSGSSFSFLPTKVTWIEEEDRTIRQIDAVALIDVGPVTFPAYDATTAGLRASGDLDEIRASLEEWRRAKKKTADEVRSRRTRARTVELGL